MKRNIIKIDESKCNGCGICAAACHEGAIGIIEGKAKLLRDDYCDGLGDCLPACPTGAISFEEREALAYDAEAVKANKTAPADSSAKANKPLACGCPGTHSRSIERPDNGSAINAEPVSSQLAQWPVQIKLVPVKAAYFQDAHLLIAADCTAYAYGDFHNRFIKHRIALVGCPKLDSGDYTEKLTEIIKGNSIKSVTIVRMEVPCCGGLERAAVTALQNSGKFIPWQVVTISTDGRILD